MPAGRYDITIERGTTFIRTFRYRDTNGAPINLTGYKARGQIRAFHESPTALWSGTSDTGQFVIDALAGEVTWIITSTDTAAMAFDSGVYDIELYQQTSPEVVMRFVQGQAFTDPEVTRP